METYTGLNSKEYSLEELRQMDDYRRYEALETFTEEDLDKLILNVLEDERNCTPDWVNFSKPDKCYILTQFIAGNIEEGTFILLRDVTQLKRYIDSKVLDETREHSRPTLAIPRNYNKRISRLLNSKGNNE
jgi:hypothetical protein